MEQALQSCHNAVRTRVLLHTHLYYPVVVSAA